VRAAEPGGYLGVDAPAELAPPRSRHQLLHWHDGGSVGVEQKFIVGENGNELLTTTDLASW
jgi:hypothetical protein